MRPPRRTLGGLVLAVFAAVAMPGLAATEAKAPATVGAQALCRDAASETGRAYRIPKHLLLAIALAESGRWHAARGEGFAWPWTVTAGGASHYFETRAAAVGHVRALAKAGVRNIDVGCMQVNLLHHPNAFPSLEQAFEPAANAAYAA